ncbi:Major Facilitator Superfamily protein [Botrimarina colliarenosi]|uniref:Major Facilitator Superfamily protein n=1 Tax=Botrimarina colliarenosi TaxID=2528001 RepID=A0A5C6A861_9BACT|nr:MFS transporter [Botrimarina colliarenosi]TWT95211.1 Major Facilitator Superfamily protein [Botrimarina colliarenosi]
MKKPAPDGAVSARVETDPAYAWVMLPLAILMQIGTSPGQTFGVALFNEPMRQSLALSHTELTGAYMIASALAAIPLMWIGRRMDRHGLRRVSLLLVAAVALSCFAISRVHGVVGLTMGFFLLRAFGQGGLSLASGNTLGMWFSRRLGLASGVAGVGMSIGIALMPYIYNYLIDHFGWRQAYAMVGLVIAVTLLPLLALAYRNNDETSSNETVTEVSPARSLSFHAALRTPAYWAALSCAALTGLICTAVFFNLTPLFERNGLTTRDAAAVFSWVAAAMAFMQLNGGMLADRVPLRVLMAMAMALLGAGVLVMGEGVTPLAVNLGGVLLGAGQGLMAVTGNTLWPRYFGRRELGSIRSSVWTATVAACSVGPFIMGLTYELTGGYGPSLWLFVSLAAAVSFGSLVWGAPPELQTQPSRPQPAIAAG